MPPPNIDRVQAVKWESSEKGGTEEDIQPVGMDEIEDALSGRGFYFQPSGGPADEAVLVWRDGSDLKLQDAACGPYTLTMLAANGITENQHEALDTIIHGIDKSSYDEIAYTGNNISAYTVWETASKLKKVREEIYTYDLGKVTQVITKQYDGTGTLKMTVTETYSYSGSKISSITRTKS